KTTLHGTLARIRTSPHLAAGTGVDAPIELRTGTHNATAAPPQARAAAPDSELSAGSIDRRRWGPGAEASRSRCEGPGEGVPSAGCKTGAPSGQGGKASAPAASEPLLHVARASVPRAR